MYLLEHECIKDFPCCVQDVLRDAPGVPVPARVTLALQAIISLMAPVQVLPLFWTLFAAGVEALCNVLLSII
jgi:hypothetical protein